MARKAMRQPAVLAATGWSKTTLYQKISEGKFPRPVSLDPEGGRAAIWWEDEVEAVQQRATPSAVLGPFQKAVARELKRRAAAVDDQAADEPRAA